MCYCWIFHMGAQPWLNWKHVLCYKIRKMHQENDWRIHLYCRPEGIPINLWWCNLVDLPYRKHRLFWTIGQHLELQITLNGIYTIREHTRRNGIWTCPILILIYLHSKNSWFEREPWNSQYSEELADWH